jgi:lipopolysaccharide/colanic/teichoic acid biosynthesis glycosyltransferase
LRLRGWSASHAVIVGANDTAVYLVKLLRAHEQYGYQVDGFVEDDAARVPLMTQLGAPYLGAIDSLERLLVERVVDAVFIALPVRSFYETIQRIAHLCEGVGVPVRFVADLFPFRVAPNRMWRLKDIPLLSLSEVPRVEPRRLIQRAEDLAVASLLIAMLGPAMLLLALLVKLESRGPVIEPQERIRRDGRRFRMYRFRCKEAPAAGATDPRAERRFTPLGAYLFRYDIDELPVLFNVWLGHMSVSEPKPPLVVPLDDSSIGLDRAVRAMLKP